MEGQPSPCSLVGDYFSDLFLANGDIQHSDDRFLDPMVPMISEAQNAYLVLDFTREEFLLAIKQMHSDKAPGPSRFNLAFY